MTIEEAIYRLKNTAWLGSDDDREEAEEAVVMAIKALEDIERWRTWSHTYDNLISKQDAIDALGDEPEVWNDTDAEWAERDAWVMHKVAIEALPSADRQTGEWVEVEKDEYEGFSIVSMRCNQCGKYAYLVLPKGTKCVYDYCPNCGAKMKGGDDE